MKVATIGWTTEAGWSELPDIDSPSTLVVVFAAPDTMFAGDSLESLHAVYGNSVVVGCSTSGLIAGSELSDDGPVAAIAQFDHVGLRVARADVSDPAASQTAGASIGRDLSADDLTAVFVLSDGLGVNGSALVEGLRSAVGPTVTITGGLAGDGTRFGETWVVDEGTTHRNRIVAVGFYGDALRVSSGSAGGWGIFGPARNITSSEGSVLYELDGRPALEIYKKYLGDLVAELPASALLFPLAIRPDTDGEQLVRTVLAIDEAEQSMTFAGDIPQGWQAQLMRSSADRLVDGAAEAAAQIESPSVPSGASLSIAVSCVGRRLVLGERTVEEIEATRDVLGPESELIGFYSYGEIAPRCDGTADLHNQTMTITSFSEAAGV